MGDLIQRDDKIPVQARRAGSAEPEPVVIEVPAGQAVPVIPATPGITQNIMYVVVPPAQPAPPSPPAQEVHYHTTNHTTNNFHPIKRRRERGTSYLGSLSLVFGALACGIAYIPLIASMAQPLAVGGMALGALGFVISILFRRSGLGVPLMGILISLAAYGIWLNNTGRLQTQYNQLKANSSIPLPAINFSNIDKTVPSSPAIPPPTPQPAPSTPDSRHISGDHSIFGDSSDWMNPSAAPAPTVPNNTPQLPVPSETPAINLATATANLETARIAAAQRMNLNYTAAKSTATAAEVAYEQAKINYSTGSPDLIDVHQKELTAASQLAEMQLQLHSDTTVAAAEQAVKTARR